MKLLAFDLICLVHWIFRCQAIDLFYGCLPASVMKQARKGTKEAETLKERTNFLFLKESRATNFVH